MKGTLKLKARILEKEDARKCKFNDNISLCTCDKVEETFLGRVCKVSTEGLNECRHWVEGSRTPKQSVFSRKIKKHTQVSMKGFSSGRRGKK